MAVGRPSDAGNAVVRAFIESVNGRSFARQIEQQQFVAMIGERHQVLGGGDLEQDDAPRIQAGRSATGVSVPLVNVTRRSVLFWSLCGG